MIERFEEVSEMAARGESAARVPKFVEILTPTAQRMCGAGFPMGPNALITIRGRKSGEPRTTPVALIEIGGRRWVSSPFGDVNWVRNLRAAGEATLRISRREEAVTAIELSTDERVAFFRDLLGPFVRRIPLGIGRLLLGSVLGASAVPRHPF